PRSACSIAAAVNGSTERSASSASASGRRLQHGEAVAWGLLAALRLSVTRGGLAPGLAETLAACVVHLVSPPRPSTAAVRGVSALLGADKKADRAGLRAILLARPGRAVLVRVETAELVGALEGALGGYN
ncbi:MAG: hypothetical protein ACXVID_01040, partial [Thermoanaerobaculia bacterium]